eukprot:gene28021-2389_t
MVQLDGLWDARKHNCAMGYTAQFMIATGADGSITISEQPGAHCCGCMPNCFGQTMTILKVSEGEYSSKYYGRTVKATVISDNEILFNGTDGNPQRELQGCHQFCTLRGFGGRRFHLATKGPEVIPRSLVRQLHVGCQCRRGDLAVVITEAIASTK